MALLFQLVDVSIKRVCKRRYWQKNWPQIKCIFLKRRRQKRSYSEDFLFSTSPPIGLQTKNFSSRPSERKKIRTTSLETPKKYFFRIWIVTEKTGKRRFCSCLSVSVCPYEVQLKIAAEWKFFCRDVAIDIPPSPSSSSSGASFSK